MSNITLPSGRGATRENSLFEFATKLQELTKHIGFKVSSRGWCYQLEGFRLINKDQFDIVEAAINECRTKGYLPVDFTAEEESRKFSGVETPDTDETPEEYTLRMLRFAIKSQEHYIPDWWDGEQYYVQMLVEKIDLKTLFSPVCKLYHIPISTSKGWSSILQRAEYSRRFKEAEEQGLECVLLIAGDHDPDGLRITDNARKNLYDIQNIVWMDGTEGYDPTNLIIDRFGLNYDFIQENNLTWIDNLITGSGKNLNDPRHPNHKMPYVQKYLSDFGPRKCEANALVIHPQQAQELCTQAIEKYLGEDALSRFKQKRNDVRAEFHDVRDDMEVNGVNLNQMVIEILGEDPLEDIEDDD